MAEYSFRYWFEWGCSENFCPCLWADDEITREKFGDVVDLHHLPVSEKLTAFLYQLGIEHDNALDWNSPSNPLLWTKQEKEDFYRKAKEGCQCLQEELGNDYQILYCEDE